MGFGWIDTPPDEYKVIRLANNEAIYVHKAAIIKNDITMGRFSYISGGCHFGGMYPIVIGKFCAIASEVYCWTYESHQTRFVSTYPMRTILGLDIGYPEIVQKPQGVRIGNDVWVGHQARIMPGVTLGDGCVIGARALVTKDCEPYGIYGGVPARLLRKRCPDNVISQLLELRWWDWPMERIRRNVHFFNLDLESLEAPLASYVSL